MVWFLSLLKSITISSGFGSIAINPLVPSVVFSSTEEISKFTERLDIFGSSLGEDGYVFSELESPRHEREKLMSYSDFARTWGVMGFRRESEDATKAFLDYKWFKENYTSFGENPPSIIHAWEKFFDLSEDVSKKYEGNTFFEKMDLPFYSKSLPFVLAEFPEELSISKGISSEFSHGFRNSDKWHKIDRESRYSHFFEDLGVLYSGDEARNKEKFINFFNSRAFGEGNLYAVRQPKELLRSWLRDWSKWGGSEDSSKIEDLDYSIFDLEYENLSHIEQGLKANVLKRWYKGKSYRMWIFNKPIKASDVSVNSQNIYYRYKRVTSDHNIHWNDDFLKNIMAWYWYSYKPGHMNDLTYRSGKYAGTDQGWLHNYVNHAEMIKSVKKLETEWNLLDVFRNYNLYNYSLNIFEDRVYADSMPLWIKAWFTGEGRNGNNFWWTDYPWYEEKAGIRQDRMDRIRWVSSAMELEDWGTSKLNRLFF